MSFNDNDFFKLGLYFVTGMLGGLNKLLNDETKLTTKKTCKVLFSSGISSLSVGAFLQHFYPETSLMLACGIGTVVGVGGIFVINKLLDIFMNGLENYIDSRAKKKAQE